jgi:LysR family hydrogen peroxide-inducible transcriptional activator
LETVCAIGPISRPPFSEREITAFPVKATGGGNRINRRPRPRRRLAFSSRHHLVAELLNGGLDLLLLALPVDHAEVETIKLFTDRFLLAMPKSRRIAGRIRATPDLLQQDRLLLLEEGHCLRDQALSFCSLRRVDNIDTFGASNLSTIVQMVANGLGLTLLPELSIDLECRRGDIKLMRFTDPQPRRVVGLAWRKSSPRKRHFVELGKLITSATSALMRESERV